MRTVYLAALLALAPSTQAAEIIAGEPSSVTVTVYRAPERTAGTMNLGALQGFAVVSERRLVSLPAGIHQIHFEGVIDGIDAASTIVSGLPAGIMEKNRDAAVLSPAALIAAAGSDEVILVRNTGPGGATQRIPAHVRSGPDQGVIVETSEGIEALHCSGLRETVTFTPRTLPGARPSVSVTANAPHPLHAEIRLSYLARLFDWSADYTAQLSADESSLALGGWVTLANGNPAALQDASAAVVAGHVNRDTGELEPVVAPDALIASCWPDGSAGQGPTQEITVTGARLFKKSLVALAAAAPRAVYATGEQLGDLKLYRLPRRTTLAALAQKQVRLLDLPHVAVKGIYRIDLPSQPAAGVFPSSRLLLAHNDTSHGLGVPLPSGRITVFADRGASRVLLGEAPVGDTAIGEDIEFFLGESRVVTARSIAAGEHSAASSAIEVTNAGDATSSVELRIQVPSGMRLRSVGLTPEMRNNVALFRLSIPPHGKSTVTYAREPAAAANS